MNERCLRKPGSDVSHKHSLPSGGIMAHRCYFSLAVCLADNVGSTPDIKFADSISKFAEFFARHSDWRFVILPAKRK